MNYEANKVGFTDDERILAKLGRESFLRIWSWPNLFRDQGPEGGDGKEICDLTVVFKNNIVFFSDKRIKFSANKGEDIAWGRWAKKALKSSLSQVEGAERWISTYPKRIFIDNKCKKPLPVHLPKRDEMEIHKILVCHGVEEQLINLNSEGSFVINTGVEYDGHWSGNNTIPFEIGKLSSKGPVHVFSEDSIWLILKEFDTVNDFIAYLVERAKILVETTVRIACESDIIQMYYESYNPETNERDIKVSKELVSGLCEISKGGLERLFSKKNYIATKQRNELSYFIDEWLNHTIHHGMEGTSNYSSWSELSEFELLVRELADTSRFERWGLAEAFFGFYHGASPGQRGTRILLHPYREDKAYLFFLMPYIKPVMGEYSAYREVRRQMLIDYCQINYLNSRRKYWVALACETRREGQEKISENFFAEGQDMVACDFTDWSDDAENETKELKKIYQKQGLIAEKQIHTSVLNEFVDGSGALASFKPKKGSYRNKPCFCGSGIKMKKCCGKLMPK